MTSPISPERQSVESALRQIAIFSDLRDDELQWFASNAEELRFAAGDLLLHEGDPADALFVLLEGEVRGRRENGGGGDSPSFVGRAGQVLGMLPFSRMTHFPVTARAAAPSWILRLHKNRFPEMLQRIPELLPRLIGVLADRIRDAGIAFILEPRIRYAGQPGEQATMFLLDPSGNALEFKSFRHPEHVFTA